MPATNPSNLEVYRHGHPDADTWILHFPWSRNPLPMNGSHGHWRTHHRTVTKVLNDATWLTRLARIPALGTCTAELTWWVSARRVRDVDNLADLEKRLFDALVRAGVVEDDRPELMDKKRGRIRPVADSGGLVTSSGFTLSVTRGIEAA